MQNVTYTQHTVAWSHGISDPDLDEEIILSFDGPGEEWGDLVLGFRTFRGGTKAINLNVFGDSLELLNDRRVRAFMALWQNHGTQTERDKATVSEILHLMEIAGIKPSKYHLRGNGRA
jgi:hypothetical protein